ncbi:hypothetical protein GUJ93_ZPchr0014g47333 [Zizania palustris]|uniref:Uncharacterized protein n=1 Tax=Zizania palustris TaxID=103762 RepID=A0A8J5TAN2_ZIZPA|nr:hypothetical protein GUJ93_ZPchr0014g47333 [Zizania palustris]
MTFLGELEEVLEVIFGICLNIAGDDIPEGVEESPRLTSQKSLLPEVYAAREKVGVYIPKDDYQQEENEQKDMADQIERMTASLEVNQKQINDLQEKYSSELQHSDDLSKKLEATRNVWTIQATYYPQQKKI